jgi:hypothetical protein
MIENSGYCDTIALRQIAEINAGSADAKVDQGGKGISMQI